MSTAGAGGRFAGGRPAWLGGALLVLAAAGNPADTRAATPPPAALPPPGSYTLQHIMAAPDGRVFDADGKAHRLSALAAGKISLLGLIYTRCADPAGCPLTQAVFDRLQREVGAVPDLRHRVQLISLSFDPSHDRPAVLRRYAGRRRDAAHQPRWWFLGPGSAADLAALLDGFGQDLRQVGRTAGGPGAHRSGPPAGAPAHGFAHLSKVFLIDAGGSVREIYSPAFLRPEVLLADLLSLQLEEARAAR